VLKLFFLLILFLVIFTASSVLTAIWRLLGAPRKPTPREKSSRGEDMVRDPECGMFLPKGDALSASIAGETHFFCSAECRDQYRRTHRER